MIAEDELGNLLVRQKSHILDLCNAEKYAEAIALLVFTEEMWAECSYAYKTREIYDRIRLEVNYHLWTAHWKAKEKWQLLLAKCP